MSTPIGLLLVLTQGAAGEVVTVDKWHAPLATPSRRAVSAAVLAATAVFAQAPFTPAPAEVVTVDKWYRPLATPQRKPRVIDRPLAQAPHTPFALPWAAQLDLPTRRTAAIAGRQFLATFPVQPTISIDQWWRELARPVRVERPLPQIEFAYAPFTPAPAVTLTFVTTSAQIFNRTVIYEQDAYAPYQPLAEEVVTIDKWWRELAAPVRPLRSIRTAQQWSLTIAPRLLTTTLEHAWFQRLGEPLRRHRGSPGRLPVFSLANINPVVPTAFMPLHVPHRMKGRLNYPAFTHRNIAPLVATSFLPLHVPHRLKGRINYPALSYAVFPELVGVVSKTVTAFVTADAVIASTPAKFVRADVSVAFGRMLRYACKAEAVDGFVEQAEESDPWTTQGEETDASDEQEQEPGSGCE